MQEKVCTKKENKYHVENHAPDRSYIQCRIHAENLFFSSTCDMPIVIFNLQTELHHKRRVAPFHLQTEKTFLVDAGTC